MKLLSSKFYAKFLLTLFITIVLSSIVNATENDNFAIESLEITKSSINFTPYDDYNEITCVGKVANKSDIAIKEVVFQVQYFNSANELVDTVNGYEYSYVVPPKEEIAFRVSGTAARKLSEDYASHKVIITSAKKDLPSSSKKRNNFIIELLISWGPMLLLITVWIFFMRKYQGKNSPQKKIIGIQEKQYELIKKQNELFSELIETIKNK